jgi:hypothetical protein
MSMWPVASDICTPEPESSPQRAARSGLGIEFERLELLRQGKKAMPLSWLTRKRSRRSKNSSAM